MRVIKEIRPSNSVNISIISDESPNFRERKTIAFDFKIIRKTMQKYKNTASYENLLAKSLVDWNKWATFAPAKSAMVPSSIG